MSHASAASLPGAILVVTGFVGTFAGGWLGDKLLARNRQAYLWLSGIATLVATPIAFLLFLDGIHGPFARQRLTVAEVALDVIIRDDRVQDINVGSPRAPVPEPG